MYCIILPRVQLTTHFECLISSTNVTINIAKNIGIEKAEPVNKEHPSIKKILENIDVDSFNFRPVTEKQVSKCIKKT